MRCSRDKFCFDYKIGNYVSNEVIFDGYEDFNIKLETGKGEYFVKVFAKFRSVQDCTRYINVIEKVLSAGVNHPFLYKSSQGNMHKITLEGSDIYLCVLEYIKGETLYEKNLVLDTDEIKFIVKQTSVINQIDIRPVFVHDDWAIVNFLKEYKKKCKFLDKADIGLVAAVLKDFTGLRITELPHCFVHGDIIKTNVMKNKKGELYIIDFSVSNYYPRIQELAVLLCNLFFDENNSEKNISNYKLAVEEYNMYMKLTDFEIKTLPLYIRAAHAMHLLSANYEEKVLNNISEENKYWLNLGRTGLQAGVSLA